MTLTDRIKAATAHPGVVVGVSGLAASFNDEGVLSPLDVHAATTMARVMGETDESVVLAAALAVRGARFGHVCIDLESMRESMVVEGQPPEVLEGLPWPDPHDWPARVAAGPMVGDGRGEEPLVMVEGRLYMERYYRYENRLVELLGARVATPEILLAPGVRTALDTLFPPTPDNSPNRQLTAAETALRSRLTVIAGGPGTGKTYTVVRMLAALAHHPDSFPRVALCAPTGKAAARLNEVVEEYASEASDPLVRRRMENLQISTIHRLLGWARGRGRFLHNEGNLLPHDMVIIDELSMVSLPLAVKLITAIRSDAKLVLAGDPFQLKSIEAGTVLGDIVGPAQGTPYPSRPADEPGTAPLAKRVVTLQRVHRFDEQGPIADFADAVRTGEADQAVRLLRSGARSVGWVEDRTGASFRRLTERLTAHRVRLVELASEPGNEGAALAALNELAVLCAHREGPGSADQWRRDIETALDERFPGLRYGGEWYPGRPLMITANDYTLDLYNGDMGVVVRTAEGLRAVFERGGLRSYPPGYLGDHSTVHALTIHKSQGSQFAEVVVSLPSEESRLLTRELLYTAVTRASRRVTIVGESSVIRVAVDRSVQRASGLRATLWGEAADPVIERRK